MDTERALSFHTRNRFMLTLGMSNYQIERWNGITLRCRYYTMDRLGVVAQQAEKMLLK